MKITTIFTGQRPDTVGFYVNAALKRMGHEVTHIDPFKDGVPKGADLFFMVDDGNAYELPHKLSGPMAFWAIDTHINMPQQLMKSKHADVVFTAQKNSMSALAEQAGKPAVWLPLACDEEVHTAENSEKIYDACFIGNVYEGLHDKRIEALDALFRSVDKFYFGQRFFKDVSNTYAQSKIVFNRSLNNDINMRVFEAIASGSMLLTDAIHDNGFGELFPDGIMGIYSDNTDIADKVRFYVENDNIRESMACAGREFILASHTYRHRMEKVLETMKEIL